MNDVAAASVLLESKLNTSNFSVMPDKSIHLYDYVENAGKVSALLSANNITIYQLAQSGDSLGLSMNFEAVTARYVDVRLERKKEVLDAYHGAVKQADPAKAEKAEPKKAKSAAKKKSSDLEL